MGHNAFSQWIQEKTGFGWNAPWVEFAGGARLSLEQSAAVGPRGASLEGQAGPYRSRLEVTESEQGIFDFRATLTPREAVTERITAAVTFRLSIPCSGDTRVFINGVPFREGCHAASQLPEGSSCRDFCAIYGADAPHKGITFTTALPAKFASRLELDYTSGQLTVTAVTQIPRSFTGTVVCQEWRMALAMDPAEALMRNARRFPAPGAIDAPVGWSTWDYYFTAATEDDVKAQADFIAGDPVLRRRVRYIALDDGWQQREGDWRSGIRYPGGLKALVDYIRSKGFEAGIWIAPTRLHNLCGTVMRRHAFLARDSYGDPVTDEDMYVLDPTHPDGEAFLRETFRYLAACGFTFYKLDFVSNLLTCADAFHDPSAGPYDALRKLFAIARETVPAGSHIMGCSLPYAAGPGVADSRRTGWDIHNTWGHVEVCLGIHIPQFAANALVVRNDLDYLVVRGPETSDDPQANVLNPKLGYHTANPPAGFAWRAGAEFTFREAKTWCAAMLMAGSSVFLGDDLAKLNGLGLELVRKTVENADFVPAKPVFDDDRIPALWVKPELGKLYVFNFSREARTFNLELARLGLPVRPYRELFSGGVYQPVDGLLRLHLESHDSLCLHGE